MKWKTPGCPSGGFSIGWDQIYLTRVQAYLEMEDDGSTRN